MSTASCRCMAGWCRSVSSIPPWVASPERLRPRAGLAVPAACRAGVQAARGRGEKVVNAQSGPMPAVRHLRQVLLWPLRLVPVAGQRKAPWEVLRDMGEGSPWREVVDEYTGDRENFHERHYQEFTAFLPYVQRFLYGEGRSRRQDGDRDHGSPMRVFRRSDVARVRMAARPADTPLVLDIVHADLYFFFDVDLVLLN